MNQSQPPSQPGEWELTDLAEMSRLESVYELSFAGPLMSHQGHGHLLSHLSPEMSRLHWERLTWNISLKKGLIRNVIIDNRLFLLPISVLMTASLHQIPRKEIFLRIPNSPSVKKIYYFGLLYSKNHIHIVFLESLLVLLKFLTPSEESSKYLVVIYFSPTLILLMVDVGG